MVTLSSHDYETISKIVYKTIESLRNIDFSTGIPHFRNQVNDLKSIIDILESKVEKDIIKIDGMDRVISLLEDLKNSMIRIESGIRFKDEMNTTTYWNKPRIPKTEVIS